MANPGCYPTAAVLALAPVVKRLKVSSVAINALSGATITSDAVCSAAAEAGAIYMRLKPKIDEELKAFN